MDECAANIMSNHTSGGAVATLVAAALQYFSLWQSVLREPWPKNASITNGSHFDFIIVGAGTAGSTLAARLAEDYDYTVLLVEAGGTPPEESIIPGFKDTLKSSPYDWNFTTVNDGFSSQGLNYGRQLQPRGKLLGGTGSINDMVYARGHPEDYYEWAEIAGSLWNWTNVLEKFKKTERMTNANIINNSDLMQFHGRDGEIEVSGVAEPVNYVDKLLEAFNELGFDIVDDMTYPYKIGAGRFSHTISHGRRASTVTALLDNVHTDNLSVLNGTLVTKILFKDGAAAGISVLTNGQAAEYYADKEVIISAGTFNTPKLMMLSGLGPKKHLEDLGIKVVQDLPVGNNLHDHIMVINFLKMNSGSCPVNLPTEFFEIIQYLYNSTGTFAQYDNMAVYIPKKNGKPNTPQFAIYPSCIPIAGITMTQCLTILGYSWAACSELLIVNEKHELLTLAVVHLKPQSRGRVRLSSLDPTQDPLIYSETFSNLADYEGYGDAIRVALSVANTTYFREQEARVFNFKSGRCSTIKNEEKRLQCIMMDYAMPAWHAVGTAAMGSVVNSKLEVLGIKKLRVVDASVMPVIVRGNTNAPVVMIAEQAAEIIKDAHKGDAHNITARDLYFY